MRTYMYHADDKGHYRPTHNSSRMVGHRAQAHAVESFVHEFSRALSRTLRRVRGLVR